MSRKKKSTSRKKNISFFEKNIKKSGRKKNKLKEPGLLGVLQKHARGFGFVTVEGEDEDIYINSSNMNSAMEGDMVEVDLLPSHLWEKSKEGIITEIVKRKYSEIVGTLIINGKFGFVVPDDKKINDDIFIVGRLLGKARDGDKVVAEIIKYPEGKRKAEGKIIEIVSRKGEAGGDIKALMRQQNVIETFPSRACAEAKAKSKEIITNEEIATRRDLRDKFIVTIDGADSKDFDDAVCVEVLDNGNYLLGVHIADVAHYVSEGKYMDQEALKRGNSIYLLDKVIPMLPKDLSNGICSLNPNEDRLTLSCDMEIDLNGNVINYDIYEAVIHSKKRLVYKDVSDIIESNEKKAEYEYIYVMAQLANILSKKKRMRGSLDFDLDEANISLGKDGLVESITIAERRSANKLIEEFMLLANETVAKHFAIKELPFVYRVHENPSLEKMEELKAFLYSFKIILKGDLKDVKPKMLSDILEDVEGEPYESVINTVTLRSMQKARYDVECTGHFGLALQYYCHFTSPIRRYADLMIHRIIKDSIHGKLNSKRIKKYKEEVSNVAEITSRTEREAIELERQVEKMKMAEYMEQFIGDTFEGVVSGVSSFGIFVELPNTIEGLIRIGTINDDYYDYVPEKYSMIGKHSGRSITLGDLVKIKVHSVSVSAHEIDFLLVD
ncbi:MAG: ribonuclease R [Anaerovoracaceae bacterium]